MERDAKEYFWGCELTKETSSTNWSFKEEEEEGDSDFLVHTLFLRNAVLGSAAVKGELNIVQIETTTFEDKEVKQPLFSLRSGTQETITMDLSFAGQCSTTFKLIEGSGPVYIGGQHLVEFPPDANMSQDESEFFTEDDIEDEEEEEEEDSPKGKKRKAASQVTAKSKKGKMEVSADDDEDEEDDEDDEEMDDDDDDDEEEEEEEETPEKPKKKGKKGKEEGKAAKGKKGKPVAKVIGKKVAAKKGKK